MERFKKQLCDITGILKTSRVDIDKNYISEWVQRLGLTEIWNAVLKRVREKS